MNRFLIGISLFFCLTLMLYTVFIASWSLLPDDFHENLPIKRYSNMHISSMLKDLEKSGPVDVLFLGASHTYRGFDVRIFQNKGIRCFNLGTSSQTPIQTEILVKKYLHQLQPKLVIYEVYPECFTLDGLESTLDFFIYDQLNQSHLKMLLNTSNIKAYNTFLLRYTYQCLGLTFKERPNNSKDHYISQGYSQRELAFYSPAKDEHQVKSWIFNSKQTQAFEASLKFFKQQQIPVILLQAPYTKVLRESIQNEHTFDLYFKTHGMYYNFNDILNLNDSLHFYDDDHLNQHGVNIFNQKLIEILRAQNHIFF